MKPLNERAQKMFDELVMKDVSELSPDAKSFLWGRRDFMNSDQKKKFAGVLKKKRSESKAKLTEEAEKAEPKKK